MIPWYRGLKDPIVLWFSFFLSKSPKTNVKSILEVNSRDCYSAHTNIELLSNLVVLETCLLGLIEK